MAARIELPETSMTIANSLPRLADPTDATDDDDVRSGGTLDVSFSQTAVYEPGDDVLGIPGHTRYTASLGVAASYRLIIDLFNVRFPLGPLDGSFSGGVGGTAGIRVGTTYIQDTTHLPPSAPPRCADPVSHTFVASAVPVVSADAFVALAVGTKGPISLKIGISATLQVIEFAYEMVAQRTIHNQGEYTRPDGKVVSAGPPASTNEYNDLFMTLMRGEVSLFVAIEVLFLTFKLFEVTLARFGGIRAPSSRIGSVFENIDACMVGELYLAAPIPVVGIRHHDLPSDCPCEFRPLTDCEEDKP